MAKYDVSDCRNNADRIKNATAVSQIHFIIETHGSNRFSRRMAHSISGRKNTVGVPIGFNHRTWAKHCAKYKGVE